MRKPKIREIPEFLRDMHKHHTLCNQMQNIIEKQKAIGKEGEELFGDDKKLFDLYGVMYVANATEALKIQAKWNM